MKIKLFFYAVLVYILAAFSWWTYSLISLSRKEFDQRIVILEENARNARLSVILNAETGNFVSEQSDSFLLNRQLVRVDKKKVETLIRNEYGSRLLISFADEKNLTTALSVTVNPEIRETLKSTLKRKERMYVFEGIFLTLLVVTGIIWIFRSIKSILELNRQQNNFLLSVTHELKTPVSAIKLILQTLQKRELSPEQTSRLLKNCVENTDRLNDLLENVLVATQVERKKYRYIFQTINFSEFIEKTATEFRQKPGLGQKIHANIEPGLYISCDPFALQLAVSNLLENAAKYSEPGTEIEINLQAHNGNKVMLEIRDQGIGIPEEEWAHIFKKFYRVGNEETRHTKGTGLGLFIVEQIVKNHKAIIEIESNSPNGTVFKICFKNEAIA